MLEPPYASFPYKYTSNKYEVKATHRQGRFILMLFNARYAAARLVHSLIGDDDIEWKNTRTIITSSGIKIESPHLEELVEHEDSSTEASWSPCCPDTHYLAQFLGRPYQTDTSAGATPPSTSIAARDINKKREPSAPREPKPDGLIGIGDITAELGMDPRDARQILRKHATKPAHGAWAWAKDQVDAIKKLLKEKRK